MAQMNITDWHVDYSTRNYQWAKVRDVLEGEDTVKDQGQLYLPKPSAQSLKEYASYKTRATFYAVAERTLRGLSGLIFRNDPVLELPARMEPMRGSLSTDGYSFEVLCQELVDELLSIGRYGLLIDFARDAAPTAVPHFATYKAEDIINWRQEFIGGKKVTTRVVLRDDIDNTYGTDALKYLELVLNDQNQYEVRVWEAQVTQSGADKNQARVFVETDRYTPTVGGKPIKEIPFVFANPYDLRPDVEKPPFLDLANMNLAHYRNSADYEHALYLTAQPTPWIAGQISQADRPKSIGSGTIWFLPENGKAGMVEFQGAGLEAQRLAIQDKEDRMAALGARMIKDVSRAQETAETTRLRGRSEMSLLTAVVNMAQASLQRAFQIAASWVGAPESDVAVTLNRDFVETRLSDKELNALVKAWQSAAISRQTLHENLQKGEIIPGDRTADDEQSLIDEEGGGMDLGTAASLAAANNQEGNEE